tara:strand:+ start:561 stop:731 length:171 start_codon:yes stop_codon:yes gene_type:complete
MKISEVYKEYRDEGKSKREAAVICLDVMTTGFFSAIEEPMRTDAINDFIKKYEESK